MSHSVHQVFDGQNGMFRQHAGTRIFHDEPNPVTHSGLVTMNRTVRTLRLLFTEGALLEPLLRMGQ